MTIKDVNFSNYSELKCITINIARNSNLDLVIYITNDVCIVLSKTNIVFLKEYNLKESEFERCLLLRDVDFLKESKLFKNIITDFFKDRRLFKKLSKLSTNKVIKIIEESADSFNWIFFSKNDKLIKRLPSYFFERFQGDLNWMQISTIENLSKDFIEKFKKDLFWDNLIGTQKFSEEELENYFDFYDINSALCRFKVSENFLNRHIDDIDRFDCWKNISRFQELTENFIRIHKEKLSWEVISLKQKMSYEFLVEFKHYIFSDFFFKNENIEDDIKYKTKDLFTRSHMESH